MLVAFSVAPSGSTDPAQPQGSVSEAVAAAVRVVRESGLPHRTDSMFTTVEGSWDECMDVVRRACEAVGIHYELKTLPPQTDSATLTDLIKQLNADPTVTGIMLHLPLPAHLDVAEIQYQIDPVKDVEGVNPANIGYVVYGQTLIAPCTAMAAPQSPPTMIRVAKGISVLRLGVVGS
jgi:uncharacterized protein YqgV (UPF0045/DUF77 family)